MLNKYLIFQSEARGNVDKKWRQCLEQIIYIRVAGYKLSKLNIFTDLPNKHKQELDIFKNNIDKTSYIG